jgi:hypothetical protein
MEPTASGSKTTDFLFVEYGALREELLKRLDIEHQLFSLAIIAAGTIFIAGVQTSNSHSGALLLFGYPILATFLGASWGHNNRRMWKLRIYIRDFIEQHVGRESPGWETFHATTRLTVGRHFFASRGVFLGTEVFAILVGIQRANLHPLGALRAALAGGGILSLGGIEWALFVVAVACVPITTVVMLQVPLRATLSFRRSAVPSEAVLPGPGARPTGETLADVLPVDAPTASAQAMEHSEPPGDDPHRHVPAHPAVKRLWQHPSHQ